MADLISRGILVRMLEADEKDLPPNPVLQVMQIKTLPPAGEGQPGRYRFVLSDSERYAWGMLGTSFNHLVDSGALTRWSLIRCKNYCLNQMKKGKLVLVLEPELVQSSVPDKIGNPQPIGMPGASAQSFYGEKQPGSPSVPLDTAPAPAAPAPVRHAATAPTGANITMIEALSPYQNKWTIRARVTQKTDIRRWHNQRGEGKLFSVNLLDESGEIRATAFNAECDMLYDVLQEGSAYYISKCRVNIAKKEFTNIQHEYELMFERGSEVTKCEDQASAPTTTYDFKRLADISGIEKDATCDVIGVLKEVGDATEITSRTTSRAMTKRELTLVDDSGYQIRLTTWGKTAQNFGVNPDSVLAFKNVRVSDFGGRSLSMISSSTMSADPDIKEAHFLKGWYDAQGHGAAFTTHQNSVVGAAGNGTDGGEAGSGRRRDPRKTLAQVADENLGMGEQPDYYSCKAMVAFFKKDNITYPACPSNDCNKKVTQDMDGTWRCERCDRSYPQPEYRYIMTMIVSDHTGQLWLSAFNEAAAMILGKSANELMEARDRSPDEYNSILANAVYTSYMFRVRAKQDNYNNTVRIRHSVMQVTRIDYVQEARELADEIEKYSL